ncbi:UDP-4-amino-4-deoxy-L-arabinose-oxoglutarate aminotransferase (plasmid) [Azospirillum sp. B510]|uniref:aminotransferase class I/II-fold pyridoxal phosphate-dependent enzyme n=1 Tax=Azospirillum sp. (strain B510) TaxID=137722 RepID=UPI0001C4CEE6|nr:aminotransferase class I/II-fold pyridoxal phosphate-dependent enzyme [Azospirillum sp. B510]BAI76766.1 UDP-4-amino-4-deoxy-L-arabinose-oxoglutarate aminotransferase [Azospirillum sp. B510]
MAAAWQPDPSFLPYGRQSVEEEDIAAVAAVLRGDWLTQGPAVAAFERALAGRVGAAGAVACANATAALRLAYTALGIGPGDAVVVPSNTFLATASAARHTGAEVAFADVDPDSGLMGVAEAEAAIARARHAGWRVRALAPVHYAGQTAPMAGLAALARAERLALVEDAAHAIGTVDLSAGERPVGAGWPEVEAGSLTVFSFHPVKTIAAGEGGAVTGNDPALMARVRRLCNHGMVRDPPAGEGFADPKAALDAEGRPNPWYYEMAEPGFNHRLSDIHAALVLSQLGRLDRFVERRARLMALYAERLVPLAPLLRPPALVPWCRPAWHLCAARIDFDAVGRTRAAVMTGLRALGIGSQVHYIPVHRQPYWRRRYGDLAMSDAVLPGAMRHYAQTLSLPLFPAMADGDVARVAAALEQVLS